MQFKTINPATEVAHQPHPILDDEKLDQRVQKAEKAFEDWRKRGFEERRSFFERLLQLLEKHEEACAETITMEMGKPIKQARGEIQKSKWVCRYYAENAGHFLADQHKNLEATSESIIQFAPLGVVYVIMPWNFPFWQLFRFAAPALMAGNTLLLKHAPSVPESALKIEALFREAGFPDGCFQNLFINYEQSDRVIANPAIQGVTLTGSKGAGSHVAQQAGSHVKKSVLELGGSDPFIVLPDADIAEAAETAATARLQNTGQSCIASKRFVVMAENINAFLEKFEEAFRSFKVGDPTDENTDLGPLARSDIRDKVQAQVDDAIDKGATVRMGGQPMEGTGFFYHPTILMDIDPTMRVYSEEVFGPVACVYTVKSEEEAIALANATEYGLGASIWSGDPERAKRLAKAIHTGSIAINGMVKSDPRLPFGGVKASGYGRELSEFGIKEFVNIKTVNVF